MSINAPLKIIFYTLIAFSIISCSGEKKALFDETPEAAAVNFFDAVYNKRELKQAVSLSTPKMARLLRSYKAISNIQRHIINLPLDEVNLTLDTGNSRMRTQYADHLRVTVILSGFYDGDKVDDIRVVHMVNEKDHWRVDEVEPDGYLNY